MSISLQPPIPPGPFTAYIVPRVASMPFATDLACHGPLRDHFPTSNRGGATPMCHLTTVRKQNVIHIIYEKKTRKLLFQQANFTKRPSLTSRLRLARPRMGQRY